MKYIVFDTETNGFAGSSLLAISAIKAEFKNNTLIKEDIFFNRYYYATPGEQENRFAIKVNGLTSENIRKHRGDCDYPLYFNDDILDFYNFTKDCNGFIAHNLSFDRKFIPFELCSGYCTLENTVSSQGRKLMDVARHYKIRIDEGKLHDAVYDTEVLFLIVEAMLARNDGGIIEYFERNKSTYSCLNKNDLIALVTGNSRNELIKQVDPQEKNKVLSFMYIDSKGQSSARKIINFKNITIQNTQYVEGFCLTRRQKRTFKKDRMFHTEVNF